MKEGLPLPVRFKGRGFTGRWKQPEEFTGGIHRRLDVYDAVGAVDAVSKRNGARSVEKARKEMLQI